MFTRILMPMALVVLTLVGLTLLWGAGAWAFIDLASLIVVPGLGTLYALLMIGFKEGFAAFAAPFSAQAEKAELKAATVFFETLGRSYLAFAFLGGIVSFIDMLRNLADKSQIGPRLAMTCISLEYAAILLAFLVIPFRTAIGRRITEMD